MAPSPPNGIDLYWLPLGAGGHSVRLNGRIFEAVVARLEKRDRRDLYHSALEVRVPEGRFVIEQAPIRPSDGAERGVVAEGAVGARAAGRFLLFRYEVRRWRDGIIPDIAEAVESPHRLSDDPDCAHAARRPRARVTAHSCAATSRGSASALAGQGQDTAPTPRASRYEISAWPQFRNRSRAHLRSEHQSVVDASTAMIDP